MFLLSEDSFLTKEAAEGTHDHDKERELAVQFKQGDITAYKKLRRMYQTDINRLVQRWRPSSGKVSTAQMKMRAEWAFPHLVMKYDPYHPKKANLNTYLTGNLEGHIRNAVAEMMPDPYISRQEASKQKRYNDAYGEAELEFGPNPTDEQVLKFLPGPKTMDNLLDHKKYSARSLIGDAHMGEDGEDQLLYRDQFTGENTLENPNDHLLTAQLERVQEVMRRRLTPQEYEVVRRRAIEGESMAQVAIGEGVSTTKLRSIMDYWDKIRAEEGL